MATELPIACVAFTKRLSGSRDEIYSKLIQIMHGAEKRTLTDWRALLSEIKSPPSSKAAVTVADALIPTHEG
jgi:hypothetical protein